MKFSDTIKHTSPQMVISPRHEVWAGANDHPVYSERALGFLHTQLVKGDRKREGTISASSLGGCLRYQQFVYLGMGKLNPNTQSQARMLNGTFMHLRWQMEGLTEGWLKEAEVALPANPYSLAGTMDGILYEDSVLELKSINLNGFSSVAKFGPMHSHLYQMATYLLCSKRSKGVFLYECKDNQEYTEIVVTPDDLPMATVEGQAEALWNATKAQILFEPLSKCIDKEGWVYQSCPFRDVCLDIHTWEEVA